MLPAFVLAAALASAPAADECEALKTSAQPAIEHANGDWVRALKAGDAAAIAAAYADDGVFVRPDGGVVAGRAQVAKMYADAARGYGDRLMDGGVQTQGLACGDAGLLYEWGRAWLRLRGRDGQAVERGGAYLTVWRRIDGAWKIVRNLAF